MTEGHMPPPGQGQPATRNALRDGIVRLGQTDAALVAGRVGLLALAGIIEGILLANSPVLERYAAIRLGPDGVPMDLTLLCAGVLGALGAAAAFAPWLQAVFLGFVITTASWSLAESSQHPFWIFSNKGVWRPHAPSSAVVFAHVAAIACICVAALGDALQAYRAAARAEVMGAGPLARDTQRLATAGLAVLGVAAAVAIPLVALLDGAADDIAGAVKGETAFTLLIGSALLLLVGLGLLAAQGRRKPRPVEPRP